MTARAPTVLDLAAAAAARRAANPIRYVRWLPTQYAFLISPSKCKQIRAGNQWQGKEQPVDEPVLTPTGWRAIGSLRVGDEVYAGDGSITRVSAVFPQGVKPVFRLTFSDGAWTRCGAEHLWKVRGKKQRFGDGAWVVMPLSDIVRRWGTAPSPPYRAEIPRPVVAGAEQDLPVEPWLLGVLLGDGCMRGGLSVVAADAPIVERLTAALAKTGNRLLRQKHPAYAYADSPYYHISRPPEARLTQKSPLIEALREIGVWGVIGHEKRVPERYLLAPAADRLELLRGLMDTDGHICKQKGRATFSTSSKGLADDVIALARSLGGTAHATCSPSYLTRNGVKKRVRDVYNVALRVPVCPVWLPRKAEHWFAPTRTRGSRLLYEVTPDGEAECVCIMVEHPDHTYITRDYIVTHNSTAALADVIGRCTGEHPIPGHRYDVVPGSGFEAWVICDSWSQAVTVMGKLWALLPKDQLHPDTHFDPRTGFRGKNPLVQFRNGAIIRIKTANQDPKSLASGTIDVALFDEPPPSMRVFTEVQSRLQAKGGVLLLAYTPVNAPVEYLRAMVDEGRIEDHWSPLTPEALIPVGKTQPMRGQDGQIRDEAWIAALRQQVPPDQAPVVIDGEWEFRARGAYFEGAWSALTMVHDRVPTGDINLHLGIDYGTLPGKQIALLICVKDSENGPIVYVLDEYVDTLGTATPRVDARGILAMLSRHGQKWSDLHCAYGDRTHMPGREDQRGNKDLSLALLREMASTTMLNPRLLTAKRGAGRGAGAVDHGGRWLRTAMIEGRFAAHPRCGRLIEALPKYTGADDGSKDPLDALRYGLDPCVFANVPRGPVSRVVLG